MADLQPKHWAVIALLIGGVATQLASTQHGWADTLTPGFVAGLLMSVASAISALFVGAPGAASITKQIGEASEQRAQIARDIDGKLSEIVQAVSAPSGPLDK
jgi:hypothetical protein